MAGELNKKQLAEAKRQIDIEIDAERANVKAILKELKNVSGEVASTSRDYQAARDACERKRSDKNERRLVETEAAYKNASEEYYSVKTSFNRAVANIETKYQNLVKLAESADNAKVAERAITDRAEFTEEMEDAFAKADKSEGLAMKVEKAQPVPAPTPAPAAPVQQPVAAPQTPKTTMTSVNVAPVSIDVTPMIEKAISSAMERLSDTMAKKIDEYVASLKLPEVAVPAPVQSSDGEKNEEACVAAEHIADTVSQLIEAEEHIIEKLKSMCTSVAEMLERLSDISSGYHDIAIKEKELAELGKQINDMQRRTTRDQQGVQVNQKLVTDEQLGIVAAQKLVVENQKELASLEKEISDVQAEIHAGHKEMLPEVKKILREQKQAAKKAETKDAEIKEVEPAAEEAQA